MQWTLGQLRTFASVAEHGSMTRAAAALGYTPGAVSQHMSALARVVGEPLTRRQGRGLVLTTAGEGLVERVRPLLAAEAQAAAAVRAGSGERRSSVTLGVFGSMAVFALPRASELLASTAPNVELLASEIDVERMADAVLDGEIDVALGLDYPAAPAPPRRGLLSQALRSEEFGVVRAAGHGAQVPAEGLWILPPAGSSFGRASRFACAAAGFAPREGHLVTDSAVALALAASGLGLTLGTDLMMALVPRGMRATLDPLPGGSTRSIVSLVREDRAGDEAIGAVRDVLAAAFA